VSRPVAGLVDREVLRDDREICRSFNYPRDTFMYPFHAALER
jgi:hypothetical protein